MAAVDSNVAQRDYQSVFQPTSTRSTSQAQAHLLPSQVRMVPSFTQKTKGRVGFLSLTASRLHVASPLPGQSESSLSPNRLPTIPNRGSYGGRQTAVGREGYLLVNALGGLYCATSRDSLDGQHSNPGRNRSIFHPKNVVRWWRFAPQRSESCGALSAVPLAVQTHLREGFA